MLAYNTTTTADQNTTPLDSSTAELRYRLYLFFVLSRKNLPLLIVLLSTVSYVTCYTHAHNTVTITTHAFEKLKDYRHLVSPSLKGRRHVT